MAFKVKVKGSWACLVLARETQGWSNSSLHLF